MQYREAKPGKNNERAKSFRQHPALSANLGECFFFYCFIFFFSLYSLTDVFSSKLATNRLNNAKRKHLESF